MTPEAYRPSWVKELARKYFTRTLSQFILYGNINDYVRTETVKDGNLSVSYLKFKDYLTQDVFRKRDIVLQYDRAGGLTFRNPENRKDFITFLQGFDALNGTQHSKSLPSDPVIIFTLLEQYFKIRLNDNKRIAFILDYAETLVPMGANSYYSVQDRALLVFLLRWARESLFIQTDMTTILIAESLADLNQQLVRNAYTAEVNVPYPDENERLAFVNYKRSQNPALSEKIEMGLDVFSRNAAGLNLLQINTMLQEAITSNIPITHKILTERKKETIESEAGGLLAFVKTKFNLDNVAGHHAVKTHLRAAAKAVQQGKQDVMPMGYLVNGPVGTGKTFLVSCFASELGVPMVELKNFRGQYVGQTESNLERVLALLKAMAPVAVMIDEADAALGNRGQGGDSGVGARVFSMIATFMSNTEHRGKIIWFLLTARPDLMPIDLKRQGRAEEHLALFYPETLAEKKELFAVMCKKTGLTSLADADLSDEFWQALGRFSGADMEAALTRTKFAAAAQGIEVNPQILKQTFEDFIPPAYPEEVELQNLVAVAECTSRSLLPERYRNLDRSVILAEIKALKAKGIG